MQTTVRNLPVPLADVGRVLPVRQSGEEQFAHRRAPMPTDDRSRELEAQGGQDRAGKVAAHSEQNRPERLPGEAAESFEEHPFAPRRPVARDALLASTRFQAQHLSQTPPYQNEPLLRSAAVDAYGKAGSLSVQYFGAFQPLDISV